MVLFVILSLFANRDIFEITLGLQELKIPSQVVALFFFSAKFMFLLGLELQKFKKTLHVRGFVSKTSWFTYTTYGNFIGMLIIKSFHNAKKLQNAMIIRGFDKNIYTLSSTTTLDKTEVLLLGLVVLSLFEIGKII